MFKKLNDASDLIAKSAVGQRLGLTQGTAKILLLVGSPILFVGGAALINSGSPDCGSYKAQGLVAQVATDHSAMQMPLRQQYSKGSGEHLQSAENDPAYKALSDSRDAIKAQLQKASEDCWNSSKHPAEFADQPAGSGASRACGVALEEDYKPHRLEEFLVNVDELRSNGADQQEIDSALISNKAAAYFFNYASTNLYPLSEKMAAVSRQMKQMTGDADKHNNDLATKFEESWNAVKADVAYKLSEIVMTEKNQDTGAVACRAKLTASVGEAWVSKDIEYTIEKTSNGDLVATVWGI